jgi:hypothetical protein
MNNLWNGTPMQQGTMLKLYSECRKAFGSERVRLVVEVMPKSVMKTIDNEQDAQITIDNLIAAAKESAKENPVEK